MGHAAEALPLHRVLLEQLVDEDLRARLTPRFEAVIQRAKAQPAEGSEEELGIHAAFLLASVELVQGLGANAAEVLRADVNGQLDELLRREYEVTETIKKLAFAHLREAVATFGKFVELYGAAFVGLPPAAVQSAFSQPAPTEEQVVNDLRSDPVLEAVCACIVAIAVGFDTLREPVEQFAQWARRAVVAARRVEPMLPQLSATLEGATVRLRAEWAWQGWDEEEIQRELTSWKRLVE